MLVLKVLLNSVLIIATGNDKNYQFIAQMGRVIYFDILQFMLPSVGVARWAHKAVIYGFSDTG